MPVFIIMIFMMFSSSVFALPLNNALSFSPPPTDLSVIFLGNIFGVVDGVLAGSGSQLFGKMMAVFNSSLLAFGSIVLMYTIIVGTLYTAHEGEFIGKNWSSIWVPVRMVSGTALLIPKASGYSLIQIFVMWVVIQGVGAADKVWNAALDYLNVGGVLVQPQASSNKNNAATSDTSPENPTLKAVTYMLPALVCMHALQKDLEKQRSILVNGETRTGVCANSSPPPWCNSPVPDFVSSVNFVDYQNSNRSQLSSKFEIPMPNFTDSVYSPLNGACGHIEWNKIELNSQTLKEDFQNNITSQQADAIVLTRAIALQQAYDFLDTIAQQIINNSPLFNPDNNGQRSSNSPSLAYSAFGMAMRDYATPCHQWASDCQIWGVPGGGNSQSLLFAGNEINNAINSYNNVMFPTLNLMRELGDRQSFSENRKFIGQSKADGWMFAGSYFFDLIKLSGDPLKKQNLTDSTSGLGGNFGAYMDNNPCQASTLSEFCSFSSTGETTLRQIKSTVSGSQYFRDQQTPFCSAPLSVGNYDATVSGYVGPNSGGLVSTEPNCSSTVLGFIANTFFLAIPGQPGVTFPPLPELNWSPVKLNFPFAFDDDCGSVSFGLFSICLGRVLTNTVILPVLVGILQLIINIVNFLIDLIIGIAIKIPLQLVVWPLISEAWDTLTQPSANPIVSLALMGADMISSTIHGAFTMLAASLGIVAIPVIGEFLALIIFPLAGALVMPWFVYFMATGFMTAFYIPLLPYMIFTFGTIAWLIAVIESMVAAPIMALGVMTPEGEGLLGRAEQGFMILLNVFLRPSMMIIGFLMGIVMTYVSVWVLSTGFGRAASYLSGGNTVLNYFNNKYNPLLTFYAEAFYVVIFISLYSTVVQKSFNLIQKLPDTVLRWIGGSPESYGESTTEWLSEGRQLTQEQAKEASQSLSTGVKEQKEAVAKYKKAKEKEKESNQGGSAQGGGP